MHGGGGGGGDSVNICLVLLLARIVRDLLNTEHNSRLGGGKKQK